MLHFAAQTIIGFLLMLWGAGLIYLLRELRGLPVSDPLLHRFHKHLYRVGWGTLAALILHTAEIILAHGMLRGQQAAGAASVPWIHVVIALLAAYPAVNFALFLRKQGLRPARALLLRLQHLQAQVKRDPLTGLLNHRAFYDEMANATLPVALLMLDVDDFKSYNDSFGHQAGDRVLATLAGLVASQVREGDLVARYGGEEFAVICPRTDLAAAQALAERIRKEVSGRVMALRRITVSIGIAVATTEDERSRIVKVADTCLYIAKRLGKDRVQAHCVEDPGKNGAVVLGRSNTLPQAADDREAILDAAQRLLGIFTACAGATAGFVQLTGDANPSLVAVLGTTRNMARRILDGVAGTALTHPPAEPVHFDLRHLKREAGARVPFVSLIAVPIVTRREHFYTLCLLFDHYQPLSSEAKAELKIASREAAALILTLRDLEAQALQDRSHTTALLHMVDALPALHLSTAGTAENALRLPLQAALEALHMDAGEIFLWDADKEALRLRLHIGDSPEAFRQIERFALGQGLPGLAAQTRRVVFTNDLQSEPGYLRSAVKRLGYQTFIAVPILAGPRLVGVLGLTSRRRQQVSETEERLLMAIAQQAAMVLQLEHPNITAREEKKQRDDLFDAVLFALAKAVEQRDADTVDHAERTVPITLHLARRFSVPESAERWITWGCILHDIGKILVPDRVLRKAGPLTEEEWQIMRRHPEVGYRILQHVPFPSWTLDIVRFHQERWDGSGYPMGLKETQIPLIARIFAVADVYDALTSDRPYRPALSHAEAEAVIQREAGRTLDPSICAAFLESIHDIEPNRRMYAGLLRG